MSGLPPRDHTAIGGDDRLTELMLDEATVGLSPEEAAELERLLGAGGPAEATHAARDREAWALVAARIAVADDEADPGDVPPMPAGLAERLAAEGRRAIAADPAGAATGTPALRLAGGVREAGEDELAWWRMPWLAWTAAAACLLLAILLAVDPARTGDAGGESGPRDARLALAEFLERAPDVTSVEWSGNGTEIAGEIFWSDRLQTGFMRLRGIDANDPTEFQYQLWIFDEARTEGLNAVDGGVFDVAGIDEAAEVVVPIDAKLRVFDPSLFAITTEPPGGVVKHDPELDPDRYRIVAVAPVEGA